MMSLEAISEALTHGDQSITNPSLRSISIPKTQLNKLLEKQHIELSKNVEGNFQGNFGFLDEKRHPRDNS